MSRSRNKELIKVKADKIDYLESLKIIVRKPRIGDIHPLSKKDILDYLSSLPTEYVYKLIEIELKPRKEKAGDPFGIYFPIDKKIVLYSHPLKLEYDFMSGIAFTLMKKEGLPVPPNYYVENSIFYGEWDNESLKKFYAQEVLFHELGHHYYYINKNKKNLPFGKFHEIRAEINKGKILDVYNEIKTIQESNTEL